MGAPNIRVNSPGCGAGDGFEGADLIGGTGGSGADAWFGAAGAAGAAGATGGEAGGRGSGRG